MPLRVENDWANAKLYQSMVTDLATKRHEMRRIAITSNKSVVDWIWNILENVWLEEVIVFASPQGFNAPRFNNTKFISLDFVKLNEGTLEEDLVGVVMDPEKTKASLLSARKELMSAISYRQLGNLCLLDAEVDRSRPPDIKLMKIEAAVNDS
jgi:hypothetical protein